MWVITDKHNIPQRQHSGYLRVCNVEGRKVKLCRLKAFSFYEKCIIRSKGEKVGDQTFQLIILGVANVKVFDKL